MDTVSNKYGYFLYPQVNGVGTDIIVSVPMDKVVKMGWNPRANLAHHGFGPG